MGYNNGLYAFKAQASGLPLQNTATAREPLPFLRMLPLLPMLPLLEERPLYIWGASRWEEESEVMYQR